MHSELISRHSEISENTPRDTSRYASVLDLCWSGVCMHLRELELGLGAHSLREGGVADHVAKGLSLGFILFKDFSLGVVANDFDVDEATNVELFCTKLRHRD